MTDLVAEVDLDSDASSMGEVKESLSADDQNRILRAEVESLKVQVKRLSEVNEQLRRNSVNIQVKAEQEEEYISNTLLKKITELKKEKESLVTNYEQEEEFLTNELNKKFSQLRQEKVALEKTLAKAQEDQVCKLKSRIEKLETDMQNKQDCLDRLRREKIELENALEQEQEALVNRLWKKMEKLETEKRTLQEKLESLGAALLSGSSSNQSLASLGQHGVVCDSSSGPTVGTAVTTSTVCVSLLLAEPLTSPLQSAAGNSRPSSGGSGQGSLRISGRLAQVGQTRTSLGSGGGTLLSAVNPSAPGLTAAAAASGDPKQHNQSSAAAVAAVASLTEHVASGQQRPTQSPMDTDAIVADRAFYSTSSALTVHSQNPDRIGEEGREKKQGGTRSPLPSFQNHDSNGPTVSLSYVTRLRDEVIHLRRLLARHEAESATGMSAFESEERSVAEENRKLRQQLAAERERREALSRQMSESESSLEMEDERHFNEAYRSARLRTISDGSTPPFHMPPASNVSAPHTMAPAFYGPGHAYAIAVANALAGSSKTGTTAGWHCCRECGQKLPVLEDHHSYPHSYTPQQHPLLQGQAPAPSQQQHYHRPMSTCFSSHQPQQWLSQSTGAYARSVSIGCTCAACSHSSPASSTVGPVGSGRPAPVSTSPSTPTTGTQPAGASHDNDAAASAVAAAGLQSFIKPASQSAGSREPDQPMRVECTPQKSLLSTLPTIGGETGSAPVNLPSDRFARDLLACPVDSNGDASGTVGVDDDGDYEEEEARCVTPPLCQADSARQ